MAGSLSLILGVCLLAVPFLDEEVPYITVKTFSYNCTGANCSVGRIKCSVFVVTFIEEESIDGIEFLYGRIVHLCDENIEEQVEVNKPSTSSMYEMLWSY